MSVTDTALPFTDVSLELRRMSRKLYVDAARFEKTMVISRGWLTEEHKASITAYHEAATKLERRARHLERVAWKAGR